jgi:hypothetical protein
MTLLANTRRLAARRISWTWLRRRLERVFAGCQEMRILPNHSVALMANQKHHHLSLAGFTQYRSQHQR